MKLVLASYNIHRCYGRDGNHSPARIKQVLQELDAQIIALQEVELLHDAPDILRFFCAESVWEPITGPAIVTETGHYGNAVLTALPILSVDHIDLSRPGHEPRGALHVMLDCEGMTLELIATHLGLWPAERRAQIRKILALLQQERVTGIRPNLTVLLGDLNEWFMWGRPLRWLHQYFEDVPAPATFPACCPVFALDRAWVEPRQSLLSITSWRSETARIASDHLPLRVQLEIPIVNGAR